MNIGEAAARAGVPAKTIRYYESIGLLSAAPRTRAGYRDYGEEHVRVLGFLRRARALGFSVERCRALLDLYRDGRRASADVRALATEHAREIDARVHELDAMRSSLESLVAACCGDDGSDCPILERLAGTETADDAEPTGDAREIAERYFDAFYAGDHATARECLADDLTFTGPAASFHDADTFLRASAHVAPGVRAVRKQRVFVDGDAVCILHDLILHRPAHTAFVAEWYRLRGDRIASIRLVLDTAPLMRPRARGAEPTEIDPVCQMRVARDSPAATRAHRGTTYYFCNEGCAVAFESDPDRFTASTPDSAT